MKKEFLAFLFPVFLIGCGNQKQQEHFVLKKNNKSEVSPRDTHLTASKNTVTGKVIQLTKEKFKEKVMNYEANSTEWKFEGDKPCIVDFYADWCKPCRIVAPILDELAAEYGGKINIYKVDTEKERELSRIFGIQSLPSFLFCPIDGDPSVSSGIGRTPEETKELFRQMINDILLNNKTNL